MGEHKADRLLRYALFLFAGSCILSITLAEAALILMLAAILWKAFTSPEGFRQPLEELHSNPLVFPLTLYLIAYIFSATFSLDPARSWGRLDTEVIKALSAVLLFSAVSRGGRERAAKWFIAGATVSALIGLWQFTAGLFKPDLPELMRAHGTMIAVTYAELTALPLILAIVLFPESQGRYRKFLLSAFLILSAGFAASLSRGPALGLFAALGIIFLARKSMRWLALAAFAITVGAFLAAAAFNPVNRSKLVAVAGYMAQKQTAEKMDPSANSRITMWKAGAAIFREYPLTGTGQYALRKVFNLYHKNRVNEVIDWPDVHNLYLQRAADSGIPGLLALLLLFGVILKSSADAFFKHGDSYGLWGFAAFTGFMAMMVTDSSFDLPRASFCIYLLAALSCTARPAAGPK